MSLNKCNGHVLWHLPVFSTGGARPKNDQWWDHFQFSLAISKIQHWSFVKKHPIFILHLEEWNLHKYFLWYVETTTPLGHDTLVLKPHQLRSSGRNHSQGNTFATFYQCILEELRTSQLMWSQSNLQTSEMSMFTVQTVICSSTQHYRGLQPAAQQPFKLTKDFHISANTWWDLFTDVFYRH